MDTQIIMLRGALHDKERELADLKQQYANAIGALETLDEAHESLKQLVGECTAFYLKQYGGEPIDTRDGCCKLHEFMKSLEQAIKEE